MKSFIKCLPAVGLTGVLLAQAPPPPEALAGKLVLPRNLLIALELQKELTTREAKPEDTFELTVAEPVRVDGRLAIAAGARATGQVIDAKPSGIFGSPAKLLFTIRTVEAGAVRVPMRLYQPSRGEDLTQMAGGLGLVPFLGVFAVFVHGGEIVLPKGTRVFAKVARDTTLEIQPVAALAEPEPRSTP